jgi:hypothetical protein
MTATGLPPSAPPGQTRWLGHAVPSVAREPGRQTLPAGALQAVQLAAPSAEKEPKPQLSQVEAVVAPSTAENLPAKQLSHLEAPESALYLPAAQSVQTEAPAPEYFPAPQAVQTEAPAPEYLPAVQLVQAVDPALAAYFPAPQERQV